MTRLSSVLSELHEHEQELSGKLEELTAKTNEVKAELSSVRAALAALRGRRHSKQGSGRGLTAELLVSEIRAVRSSSAKLLSDEELRDAVKTRLKARGKALVGLAMVWPHALQRLDGKTGGTEAGNDGAAP